MWPTKKPRRRPSRLKSKWLPELHTPHRPQQLAGRTARDIVEAAYAIKADEYAKKQRRIDEDSETKHKAAVAAVTLAKMPWDDP